MNFTWWLIRGRTTQKIFKFKFVKIHEKRTLYHQGKTHLTVDKTLELIGRLDFKVTTIYYLINGLFQIFLLPSSTMRVQFELINRLESRSVFIGELKKLPKSDAKFYQNLLNFIQTSNILEKTIKTIILQLLIRLLLNPSSTVILYT
jgi:hypothetical protein